MKLNKLKLLNFKSHLDSRWNFDNNIVCFIGDNGSGKTNILDAIHYLSLTKSYFNSRDSVNIHFDNIFFTISGDFEINNVISNVVCSYQKDNLKKAIKNNGKKYKRFSDHIGLFPLVIISPSDSDLITLGSDLRRKFLDGIISQFDHSYLENLLVYNKAVTQRNALLKYFQKNRTFNQDQLDSWNGQLVKYGEVLFEKRQKLIYDLTPVFQKYYQQK